MSELQDALRRRFRSPKEALDALGLDHSLLIDDDSRGGNHMPRFTPARKLGGRDENEPDARQEIHELIDDPEASPADVIAAVITNYPDDVDLHEMLHEVAEDVRAGRSYRQHAADRLERRKIGKDARARRRLGRDDPDPFPGRPNTGGSMEPLDRREGEDRHRRMGADSMAFDRGTSLENFLHRFPALRGRVPARF